MRADINIFELLKETGSYKETKKRVIEEIKSNPNVIYELDVYGGVINEEVAELLASVIYWSNNQHSDKVQIKGRFLSENESKLIVDEYVRLCGREVKTTFREIFTGNDE